MNVLYQQGLESVAEELAGMGYSVHPLRSHIPADAILYTSDAHSAMSANAAKGGAPILCVRGMNAAQISRAIKKRSCRELF